SAAAAIVLITLSSLSWKQTTHWRDTEALWRHTLAVTPDSDVAHAGLGGILFVRGQIDESIDHYERALRLRHGNVAAHVGVGRARRGPGSGGESPVALRTLAAAQAENGEFAEAIATCRGGEELAQKNGDRAMAESLHSCAESFRRGEVLRGTQVSH